MKPGTQKALRDQLRTWVAKNLLLAFTFSGVSLGIILGICLRWEGMINGGRQGDDKMSQN